MRIDKLPVGYTSRPATMDDVAAAVSLFNACSRALTGETRFVADEVRVEWRTPEFDMDQDTRVVLDSSGHLVGYGEVWDREAPHVIARGWGRVHPDRCGLGIGAALLTWQEERARRGMSRAPEGARVAMSQGALVSDDRGRALLERHGFAPIRRFWRMVIEMDSPPAEAGWPEGIAVRSFDPDRDLERTVHAVRDAFRDHWGHVDTPFEEELKFWRHWITEEKDFDPSLWLLAESEGEIAGICLGWPVRHEDPEMGWINVLGVVRSWRKRGLALALLHHSFGEFHRRGKRKVGLGVDASSLTGATRLYERAGMKAVRESISYEKELRPGKDLTRRTLDEEGAIVNERWNDEWTVRPATPEDLDAAVDMFNARSQEQYGENQTSREDMLGWWKSPRFDLATDTQIVVDRSGRIVGWAHVANPGEPFAQIGCGVITHPVESANEALWDRLYAWAGERASRYVALAADGVSVALVGSASADDLARRGALERAGFRFVRVQNRMRIDLAETPLSPEWPAGIGVRAIDLDVDLPAASAASTEAFRDHWGFVESPQEQNLEDWRSWTESLGEALDPSLWYVAHDGAEIAGLCLFSTKIADDSTRSYVESLSVRPAYRKRGVALALLRNGFKELHRRGYEAVELDMDSENLTGALRLYERAGMRVIRQTCNYEKELRAGVDLATRTLEP